MKTKQSPKHLMLRFAFRRQSIAILSMLAQAPLRYTDLMNRFNMTKKSSGYFAHYLRYLRNFGVITHYAQTGEYDITGRGKEILKTWNMFNEKFATENQDQICHNSDGSNEHEFFKMCKSCGIIIFPKNAKEGLQ
jgi:predicted transcriptional regulator